MCAHLPPLDPAKLLMSVLQKILAVFAVVVTIAVPQPLASQENAQPPAGEATACAGPESHRFDFWAGIWSVESRMRNADGDWVETEATWRAEEILGGCAFIDFARGDFGGGPMRGMGSRYYEPRSGTWYITWLSTRAPGRLQVWEGGFEDDGTASFLREISTPEGTVLSRIRWWDLRDDFAEWEHAVSRDGGETWQPTWRMTFRRDDYPRTGGGDGSDGSGSAVGLEERLEALLDAGVRAAREGREATDEG